MGEGEQNTDQRQRRGKMEYRGKEDRGHRERELLARVGLSIKEWNNSLQREEGKMEELLKRLKREEKEEIRRRNLEKSGYSKDFKETLEKEKGVLRREKVKRSRSGLEIIGRFRMGNEERANDYQKKEEEIKCRLCGSCEITGTKEVNWERYLKGDTKSVGKLNEIIWIRKRNQNRAQETDVAARLLIGYYNHVTKSRTMIGC